MSNDTDPATARPVDIRFYRLIEIGGTTATFEDDLEMRRIESNGAFFETVVGRAQTEGQMIDVETIFPDFYQD